MNSSIQKNQTEARKPKSRIPFNEKTNADYNKTLFDYYDGQCVRLVESDKAYKALRLATGHLEEEEYNYIVNPLNTDRPELKGFPAKIRNYDIISPVIQQWLSEKRMDSLPPEVIALNSDINVIRKITTSQLYNANLQKAFYNELINGEVVEGQPLPIQKIQEIKQQVSKIPDEKSILGKDIIDDQIYKEEIDRKMIEAFYYYICLGTVVTYKDVFSKKLYYNTISPLDVRILKKENEVFLEDAEAQIITHYKTVNEIYEIFQNDPEFESSGLKAWLDTEEAEEASDTNIDDYHRKEALLDLFTKLNLIKTAENRSYNHSGIRVDHLICRNQVKVGKLKRRTPLGSDTYIPVDERYVPLPTDEITWEWVEQPWEVFKIHDRYYIGGKPYVLNNNRDGKAKLPGNGRKIMAFHSEAMSIPLKGEAYQKKYNIVKYRMELTLGRNLDSFMTIPLGLVKQSDGWDEFQTLYYMQALGVLFVDETNENAQIALNALKQINMSAWQYINNAQTILETIVNQWHSSIGFNAQRMSQISNSAGKGTTQQAINSSAVNSYNMFAEFEDFERREYTGILRLAPYLYDRDTKSTFVRTNGEVGELDIQNVDKFWELEFDTHVKSGKKQAFKKQTMKEMAHAFAQNQESPQFIAKIIEEDNFGELMKYMDQLEENLIASKQSAAEAAEAQDTKDKQHEKDIKGMDVAIKKYEVDAKHSVEANKLLQDSGVDTKQLVNILENTDTSQLGVLQEIIDNRISELRKVKLEEKKLETALENKVVGEK